MFSFFAHVCLLKRSCPDVKAEMFELLFQILHQNWRFFFKTSVLSSVQRTGAEEVMENQAQFSTAMQVSTPGTRRDFSVLWDRDGGTPRTNVHVTWNETIPNYKSPSSCSRHLYSNIFCFFFLPVDHILDFATFREESVYVWNLYSLGSGTPQMIGTNVSNQFIESWCFCQSRYF